MLPRCRFVGRFVTFKVDGGVGVRGTRVVTVDGPPAGLHSPDRDPLNPDVSKSSTSGTCSLPFAWSLDLLIRRKEKLLLSGTSTEAG